MTYLKSMEDKREKDRDDDKKEWKEIREKERQDDKEEMLGVIEQCMEEKVTEVIKPLEEKNRIGSKGPGTDARTGGQADRGAEGAAGEDGFQNSPQQ